MSKEAEVRSTLVGTHHSGATMAVDLIYSSDDPYAIIMAFRPRPEWFLARDLLAEGLNRYVGEGDVRIWRCLDVVYVVLHHEITAVLKFAARDISAFLDHTYDLVPQGKEVVDVDKELARLSD